MAYVDFRELMPQL